MISGHQEVDSVYFEILDTPKELYSPPNRGHFCFKFYKKHNISTILLELCGIVVPGYVLTKLVMCMQ